LSDNFSNQSGLIQGDALLPLLFSFALEYSIRKLQQSLVGMNLSRTHQLLAYADDVNLLAVNIGTIKKNTETLIDGSEEDGLEINLKKINYMLLSCHQNAGENHDVKIPNRLFENLSHFQYLT
jgi:hypothetical protein